LHEYFGVGKKYSKNYAKKPHDRTSEPHRPSSEGHRSIVFFKNRQKKRGFPLFFRRVRGVFLCSCFSGVQRRSSELEKTSAQNFNVEVFCSGFGVILRNVEDLRFEFGDILLNAIVFICDFF